ncbi:MAG: hypothetical protein AAFV95_11330 [Bacteroidota bacterium]
MKRLCLAISFLCLLLSCGPKVKIDATAEVRCIGATDDQQLQLVQEAISERLKKGGFSEAKIQTTIASRQIQVSALLPEGDDLALAQFRAIFASVEMGLWNLYRHGDPEIAGILDSLPDLPGFEPYLPEQWNGSYREVLGWTNDPDRFAPIKERLKEVEAKHQNLKLVWQSVPTSVSAEQSKRYPLYMLNTEGRQQAPINQTHIAKAKAETYVHTGEGSVAIDMTEEGTEIWAKMTTKAAQDGNRCVAIVIDGIVQSAPRVLSPITGGQCVLTGNYDQYRSQQLAASLSVGRLPCPTHILTESLSKTE